jgi:predicted Na+-dependent transporter
MSQTKAASLAEAIVNTTVGLVVGFMVTPVINWICGIEMSGGQMTGSILLFTVLSIVRGYVVRRFFNNLNGLKSTVRKIINACLKQKW